MNDLNPAVDLTDPVTLKSACEEMQQGMEQQAMAANGRNAMQGHPNPVFFFHRAAAVFKAASAFVEQHQPGAVKPPVDDPKVDPKKK